MDQPSTTSLSLLVRAQARQAGAWERLVELYGPLVCHWCRQCRLPDADVADIFQEVFQAVAAHLGRFRRDQAGDTFRGWLRTITRNKIRDHFRDRQHHPAAAGGSEIHQQLQQIPDPLLGDEDPSEADLTRRQLLQALEWIAGDFEPRTWQAFWKVQVEGQDTGSVARELDMTTAAVRKAKYRVLQRLREELKDLLF
jgi:RNA polymerase sigma-70 factor (ECF subfamily)